MSKILSAGTVAPNFALRVTPDQYLSLSDLAGRPVVLAFYPADWSPVCGDQLTLYNEVLPEFHKHDAEILGVSVDGAWCHEAFVKDRRLRFPLLADFHPKGAAALQYGAYREAEGVCERALFVIDRQGVIFWAITHRLLSILVPTAFWTLWKDCQKKGAPMGMLKDQSGSMTISKDRRMPQ